MAKDVNIKIKVDKKTGAIDATGKQFDKLAKKAKKAKASFGNLSGATAGLLKGFAALGGAVAIFNFFKNAITGAEEMIEGLRRLQFAIEASGDSWEKNKKKALEWIDTIQINTRFMDTDAVSALEKFVRVTGDTGQAMRASQIAMGLQVQTGKRMRFITNLLADTINKEKGALTQLRREFGAIIPETDDFQEVLDVLDKKFGTLIFNEKGLTSQTAKLRDAFERVRNEIGTELNPALIKMLKGTRVGFITFLKLVTTVGSQILTLKERVKGFAGFVKFALKFDLKSAKAEWEATTNSIIAIEKAAIEQLIEIDVEYAEFSNARATARVLISEKLKAEEIEKIRVLEEELNVALISMGQQTLDKKIQLIQIEISAKERAIRKEVLDVVKRDALLEKLRKIKEKKEKKADEENNKNKQRLALNVIGTAVNTLQVLNQMDERSSSSQRTRARALLAIQQAVAIGWIWVNAAKAGPLGIALAATQTALVVANFASQLKAIDKSKAAENSELSQLNSGGSLPSIPSIPSTDGTVDVGGLPSGGSVSVSGVSRGRGGGTIIDVGGINVNIDVEKFGLENVNEIMNDIADAVRQGTTEGIQLALSIKNASDANSNLAV